MIKDYFTLRNMWLHLAGVTLMLLAMVAIAQAQEVNMAIISTIESNNNPKAYNKHSGAIGLCQITPCVLQDYNKAHAGNLHIDIPDLWDRDINYAVAYWYMNEKIPQLLRHYHINDTIDHRIAAYNEGIGNVVKGRLPKETRDYIAKYHKLERRER